MWSTGQWNEEQKKFFVKGFSCEAALCSFSSEDFTVRTVCTGYNTTILYTVPEGQEWANRQEEQHSREPPWPNLLGCFVRERFVVLYCTKVHVPGTRDSECNGSLKTFRQTPTNSDKFVNFPTNFNTFRRMTFRRFYIPTKLKTFRQTSTLSEEWLSDLFTFRQWLSAILDNDFQDELCGCEHANLS
jgi:hypothetical protein